jgi:A/G-specific adenine glycosylase
VENRLWAIAEKLTPPTRIADYTQAIMDLGATVCTRSSPGCGKCPVQPGCLAYRGNSVASFPQRKPGKKRPLKHTRMLLIRNPGHYYLLVKRPPAGIWGGLWSLPQLDEKNIDCRQYCHDALGIEITPIREQAVVRHGFTHFDLDIEPVMCETVSMADGVMDASRYLWYNPSTSRQVGLPAAVTKIFRTCIED